MKYLLGYCLVLCTSILWAQPKVYWEIGAAGGLTSIPYTILSGKTSSGTYFGGYMRRVNKNKGYLEATIDYGKVSNLRLQSMQQNIFVLPEQTQDVTSLTNLTSFSEVRLSLTVQPHWLGWKRIRMNFGAYTGMLTATEAFTLNSDPLTSNFFALTDEALSTPGNRSGEEALTTAPLDVRNRVMIGWKLGLRYALKSGPEFHFSFHSDLTDRFVMFRGNSDARLYQVRLGFTAPIAKVKIKKNSKL